MLMKTLFRSIFVIAIFMCISVSASAETNFSNETLRYVITYKWGLIHKDAGEATMSLRNTGSTYNIKLVGKTKSWADKFYKVRDTLISVIKKDQFRPQSYTRIAHEGGKYAKDVIAYSYSGTNVNGKVNKFREKKNKITTSSFDLSATGPTFDMLSVFYYLRTLDPANLITGKKITSTLFSGSHAETVTIWKVGEGNVKMRNGTEREAWHLRFKFTSKGGKKSSDDIDAWISKDSQRIPLQITGSLPIGKVNAYLI